VSYQFTCTKAPPRLTTTLAERYNAEAAKLAWDRTLAFFAEKLKVSA
jgi:dienelactone hydrolase